MKIGVKLNTDLVAGAVFFAFGAALLIIGHDYPMGTMMRVGPGFFPTVVGWALVVVGLFEFGRGLLREGDSLATWTFRPLVLVSGSFLVFALLVERIGLVVSGILVMGLSALAGPDAFRPKQIAVIVLAPILAAILFIQVLRVPLRIWP